jgi:hypothetical protein
VKSIACYVDFVFIRVNFQFRREAPGKKYNHEISFVMQNRSLRLLFLCAIATGAAFGQTPATAKASAKSWTPPKTSWGEPDLQGVWTGDDFYGVPFERPEKYGSRKFLTDEEICRAR